MRPGIGQHASGDCVKFWFFDLFMCIHVHCMHVYTLIMNKVNKTFSKNVQGCRDGSAKNHSN